VPAFELLIGENIPEAVRTSNKSYSNLLPRIFASIKHKDLFVPVTSVLFGFIGS
jgi:hypothetical protein